VAGQGEESAAGECLIRQQVWTFIIQGGQPFRLTLPVHPLLDHPGTGMTIWKMVGVESEALAVENCVKSLGCVVQRYTEVQTEEQLAERQALLR
jgi:hypothetical protein